MRKENNLKRKIIMIKKMNKKIFKYIDYFFVNIIKKFFFCVNKII